jgi:putative inorganic carbon (hco3(-)) transporter
LPAALLDPAADPAGLRSDVSPSTPPPPTSARLGFGLYAAQLVSAFVIALSNILLGVMVLAAPWARRRPASWAALAPLYVPAGVYVLWLAGSVLASYDPLSSARALSEVFNLAPLFLGPLLVRGEREVRRVVDGLVLVAALLACAGLAQLLFGYGDIEHRIRGPFSHYMTFSGFLLIANLLLIASLASPRWRGASSRIGRWAALVAVNAALLGSYTRSAWVALAVALTVLLLIRAPRWLLAYAPAAVLFLLLAPVPLVHRALSVVDLRDVSNYDRLCMLEAGAAMVAERPLFGLGPRMAERRYPIYRPPSAPRFDVPHLHNSFLQLAAERGLPSLAAYLGMIAASLYAVWRLYRREGGRRGPRADLYLGVFLALLAFNTAGLFENNWGDTEVQRPVLFLLALPFCLLADREEGSAPGDF